VGSDERHLRGIRSPPPVAEQCAAVVEEMLRVRVKQLRERGTIVKNPRRLRRARRRRGFGLTCHRTSSRRPYPPGW
jgi:hypothetical protein